AGPDAGPGQPGLDVAEGGLRVGALGALVPVEGGVAELVLGVVAAEPGGDGVAAGRPAPVALLLGLHGDVETLGGGDGDPAVLGGGLCCRGGGGGRGDGEE